MLKENLFRSRLIGKDPLDSLTPVTSSTRVRTTGLLVCALGFVVCLLLTVNPLIRIPDNVVHLHIFLGTLLADASDWLPGNNSPASIEFFSLLLPLFLFYGLAFWLLRQISEQSVQKNIRRLIWAVAVLGGLIYLVTPALLSHDTFVYASYSRLLAAYHANPYFVPIASFPRDPFTPLNYYARTVSAYGPIWMLVCGFFGQVLPPSPTAYVLAFRLFALAFHLLNIWLVGRTLLNMGRSPHIVTLGMLLYAWNPLVLLESGLGGHNDVFMMTFVLFGILFAVRAETPGADLRPREYLLPVAAFTLAVLVKFTALPILAAYLLFVLCKKLRTDPDSPEESESTLQNWRPALRALFLSVCTAVILVLAFYGPFWFGHQISDILKSFSSPPSAQNSQNSFMRAVIEWFILHPNSPPNFFLILLSRRLFWDILNYVIIALSLIIGFFKLRTKPTVRTFVLVALATLSLVLLFTPWFYPWYITWILVLVVVCLPVRPHRLASALLGFTLIFSFSSLTTYLFNYSPLGSWRYLLNLPSVILPTCALLLILLLWHPMGTSMTRNAQK